MQESAAPERSDADVELAALTRFGVWQAESDGSTCARGVASRSSRRLLAGVAGR